MSVIFFAGTVEQHLPAPKAPEIILMVLKMEIRKNWCGTYPEGTIFDRQVLAGTKAPFLPTLLVSVESLAWISFSILRLSDNDAPSDGAREDPLLLLW